MFTQNKSSKIYEKIILRARERVSLLGYKELHHIIPRCMGGKDEESNLVYLTAKEHFICHLILPKMVADQNVKTKLAFALWRMTYNRSCFNHTITATQYAKARSLFSKQVSLCNKGKIVSRETKALMSGAAKRRWQFVDRTGANNAAYKGGIVNTPWGTFTSEYEAFQSLTNKEGISVANIRIWCRYTPSSVKISKRIVRRYPTIFQESDIGKGLNEKGFSYSW